MTPRQRTALTAALLLAGALLLGPSLAQRGMGGAPGAGYGPGTMGGYGYGTMGGSGYGGGYGPGMMGQGFPGQALDFDAARTMIRQGGKGAIIDPTTNTVTYDGTNVTLDVIAVQPGKPDTTFEVAGLVDPTVKIARGATVTLRLVNMDYGSDMPHGLVITRTPPPYPYMAVPMMGGGMMRGGTVGIPPLDARSDENLQNATYASATVQFRAAAPGTYDYVCQVPGHAQGGMYGTLVVD